MIPLRDDNPTRSFAFVTVVFIIANILAFIHEWRLPPEALDALVQRFGLIPAVITQQPQPADYLTVFSSMFLHGGLLHLAGNMLFLWVFGNNIEDAMGHGRYILFYRKRQAGCIW